MLTTQPENVRKPPFVVRKVHYSDESLLPESLPESKSFRPPGGILTITIPHCDKSSSLNTRSRPRGMVQTMKQPANDLVSSVSKIPNRKLLKVPQTLKNDVAELLKSAYNRQPIQNCSSRGRKGTFKMDKRNTSKGNVVTPQDSKRSGFRNATKPPFVVRKVYYSDESLYTLPESKSCRPPEGILAITIPHCDKSSSLNTRSQPRGMVQTMKQPANDLVSSVSKIPNRKLLKVPQTLKNEVAELLKSAYNRQPIHNCSSRGRKGTFKMDKRNTPKGNVVIPQDSKRSGFMNATTDPRTFPLKSNGNPDAAEQSVEGINKKLLNTPGSTSQCNSRRIFQRKQNF